MLHRVSLRMRSAALLMAVVVSLLLTHAAHAGHASVTKCEDDSEKNPGVTTQTTGCFTPTQQANTLTAMNAFAAALPGLRGAWVGVDFCAWAGVWCYAGAVELQISSAFSSLTGTLPEIPDTVDPSQVMITLVVLSNQDAVTGTLPESWSRMRQLRSVNLYHVNVYGALPAWTSLANLQEILMESTAVTGPLPSAWSQLTSLKHIAFGQSRLTGTLPESWSALTNVAYVFLQSNQLSGTLPASWTKMTSLAWNGLMLFDNNFCGCVPASWLRATSSPFADLSNVDAKNTEAGGCATANVCSSSSSSGDRDSAESAMTTTAAPDTTTTSTAPPTTSTESPVASSTTTTTTAPTPSTTATSIPTTTTTTVEPRSSGAGAPGCATAAAVLLCVAVQLMMVA